MASTIRIKRTTSSGAPGVSTLAGELAYSYFAGTQSNGGDRLYIGGALGGAPNNESPVVIGGKYFTDMLDHVKGVLTADSALVTDANSLVASIKTGVAATNLTFSSDTITAGGSATDLNIFFTPKNNGVLRIAQQASTTPYEDLLLNEDDIPNKKYVDDLITAVNSLVIEDEDLSNPETVAFGIDTLQITGGVGIDTAVSRGVAPNDNRVILTVSGELAAAEVTSTDANKGVASFNSSGFSVTTGFVSLAASVVQSISTDGTAATPIANAFTIAGGIGLTSSASGAVVTIDAVIAAAAATSVLTNAGVASFDSNNFEVTAEGWVGIKASGVSNAELVNSTITLGDTVLTLGAAAETDLTGLTSLEVGDLTLSGSTISAEGTATDINIIIAPKGAGVVDVSNKQIVNVANPTQSQHAATKAYVDAVKTGLDIKDSVRLATTAPLVATALGTGLGKTLTGAQEILEIDGIPVAPNDRILVIYQGQDLGAGPVGSAADNGIYTVTIVGDAGTQWELTRAIDADQNPNTPGFSEVTAGLFTFVEEGTANQDSGWVLTTDNPIIIDTTELNFTQFSGAGSVDAGQGVSRVGSTINVGQGDGILVTADHVSVNTSIAGDGLTATPGGTYGGATTLQVVGTADRILVNADSVDISPNYVGQTTITTLGTVATGVWNGTVITVPYGGTGKSTFTTNGIVYGDAANALKVTAAGTDGYFLYSNAGTPDWTNTIDGGTYGV